MEPDFVAIYDNFENEINLLKARNPASRLVGYMRGKGISNPLYSEYADPKGIIRVVTDAATPNNGFAVLQYPDHSIYFGQILNGLRHGTGSRTYPGNIPLIYVGEYVGGKKNGRGRLVDAKSGAVVYDGEWKMDKKDGVGVLYYDQGTYRGEFRNDMFHGRGKLSWRNGDVYEGDFLAGQRTGRGILKFASNDIYEGEFQNGLFHGQGTYKWANGEVYVGQFQQGQLMGQGTIKYAIDVRGVGQFGPGASQVRYDLTNPSRITPTSTITSRIV